MNLATLVYLSSIATGLKTFFTMVGSLGLVLCIPFFIESVGTRFFRIFLIFASVFSVLLAILIPNSETVLKIAGASLAQDVVESPEAKKLGDKVLDLINKKLDEQLGKK